MKYLFILFALSAFVFPEQVTITLVSQNGASVTIAGNHERLGNWDPELVPMERLNDSTFVIKFQVLAGTVLEYKFTQGSWESEALDSDGKVPGNHKIYVNGDTSVNHHVRRWGNRSVDPAGFQTGNIQVLEEFYSPQLQNKRKLRVWLPPSYNKRSEKRYPVLYLHDGQNIFAPIGSLSGEEWNLDETATRLMAENKMNEIIMVGIDNNAQRTAEYSPVHLGEKYSQFLIETVKPYIDEKYRTLPGASNTAIAGSSMGGIISFHLGWEYSDVFTMAGCFSPAFLVDENEIVTRVETAEDHPENSKFIIFNGTEALEDQLLPAIESMKTALDKKGFPVYYKIFEGAYHTEKDWAVQAEEMFIYFFGK